MILLKKFPKKFPIKSASGLSSSTSTLANSMNTTSKTVKASETMPAATDANKKPKIITEPAQNSSSSVPLNRYGKVEEVAALVAFVAGPEASFITRSIIY